jgi:hypothetical protein
MSLNFKFDEEDKQGTLKVNGFGSYKLVPYGMFADLSSMFNDAWENKKPELPDWEEINAKIDQKWQDLENFIPDDQKITEITSQYIVDEGISATVSDIVGSYATLNGQAAAMHNMYVGASGIDGEGNPMNAVTGIKMGAMVDNDGSWSAMDMLADNFRLYALDSSVAQIGTSGDLEYYEGGTWKSVKDLNNPNLSQYMLGNTGLPAFQIAAAKDVDGNDLDYYEILLNGNVTFADPNNESTTLIRGGYINADLIQANKVIIGADATAKHLGAFPADDFPDIPETPFTYGDFVNYTIKTGDTYYNTTEEIMYQFVDEEWRLLEGTSSFVKYVFKSAESTPSKPVGGGYSGTTFIKPGGGWDEDAATPTYGSGQVLYMSYCSVKIEVDGTYTLEGEWSEPTVFSVDKPIYGTDFLDGENGSYTSYVYYVHNEDTWDESYNPTGGSFTGDPDTEDPPMAGNTGQKWTDEPKHGVDQIEWVSKCTYKSVDTYTNGTKNTSWVNNTGWSVPKIFYRKGDQGFTGEATNIVFKRATTATKPGDSAGVPTSEGWLDNPPTGTLTLWASKGTKELGGTEFTWSDPYKVEGEVVAEVYIYSNQTIGGAPGLPSGASYDFKTNTLNIGDSNWNRHPPSIISNWYKVYGSVAVVTGNVDSTQDIAQEDWSDPPFVYSQRQDGGKGDRGSAVLTHDDNLGAQDPGDTAVLAKIHSYWNIAASGTDLGTEVSGDQLILTNNDEYSGWTNIYTYKGGSWADNTKLYVNGDAVVKGTLAADRIAFLSNSQPTENNGSNIIYFDEDEGLHGRLMLGDIEAKTVSTDWVYAGTVQADKIEGDTIYGKKITGAYGSFTKEVTNDLSAVLYAFNGTGNRACFFDASTNGTKPIVQIGKSGESSYTGLTVNGSVFSIYANGDAWVNGTVTANNVSPFTGVHTSYLVSIDEYIYDIVEDIGEVYKIGILDGFGKVKYTTTAECKSVLGVYAGMSALKDAPDGCENSNEVVPTGTIRCGIASLGEGFINVCSQNGDIECGDYICSSDVRGKGMKQDDDLLHNYTVAKARENIVWDDLEVDNTKVFELDGHKWTQIACTYHCG